MAVLRARGFAVALVLAVATASVQHGVAQSQAALERVVVRGRAVDERGLPLARVSLHAPPTAEPRSIEVSCDPQGCFTAELAAPVGEPAWLAFVGSSAAHQVALVDDERLVARDVDLGVVVLARLPVIARGTLRWLAERPPMSSGDARVVPSLADYDLPSEVLHSSFSGVSLDGETSQYEVRGVTLAREVVLQGHGGSSLPARRTVARGADIGEWHLDPDPAWRGRLQLDLHVRVGLLDVGRRPAGAARSLHSVPVFRLGRFSVTRALAPDEELVVGGGSWAGPPLVVGSSEVRASEKLAEHLEPIDLRGRVAVSRLVLRTPEGAILERATFDVAAEPGAAPVRNELHLYARDGAFEVFHERGTTPRVSPRSRRYRPIEIVLGGDEQVVDLAPATWVEFVALGAGDASQDGALVVRLADPTDACSDVDVPLSGGRGVRSMTCSGERLARVVVITDAGEIDGPVERVRILSSGSQRVELALPDALGSPASTDDG